MHEVGAKRPRVIYSYLSLDHSYSWDRLLIHRYHLVLFYPGEKWAQ